VEKIAQPLQRQLGEERAGWQTTGSRPCRSVGTRHQHLGVWLPASSDNGGTRPTVGGLRQPRQGTWGRIFAPGHLRR